VKILEDPPLAVDRKLPWLIDVFLYPLSAPGAIHLAIFWLGPLVLSFVYKFVLARLVLGILIALFLYMMLIGYALYYLSFCVFDSSKGRTRAPDISLKCTPDKADLVSQSFLILGSAAICF
jgi:hypothetical protein